ncbi:MAG: hypothetical protein JSW11_04880 [Candidatus Heimdallarchaeota archaeon]|nr:MAG: hypothetical protein JSW11_04880 [Candidatus Heimdallarchaeota archaeon]
MKSFDVDARHLIRTYVDGIEEYLRQHTRLHPNEIDSLLNEINDFVYLRSGELAIGDRVQYSDVIKAIEECGSPSEICEQYLELDREDQPQPFTPKGTPSPKPSAVKQNAGETESQTQVYIPKRQKMRDFRDISYYYSQGSRWFSLYRILFLVFIIWVNIALFIAGYTGIPPDWWFGSYDYYISSLNFCFIVTFWAIIFVLWEGILVNKWKAKLSRENKMDRSLDDTVLVWTSRVTFLLLFFKSSILLHLSYLFLVPIWLFLACFVERQLKSELWVEKLGPWLVSLGSFLANPQESKIKDLIPSSWIKFSDTATNQEKGFVAILAGMLVFTFVFPWNTAAVIYGGAYLFTFLSLVIIIGTLVVLRYSRTTSTFEDPKSATDDSEIISWLVRLLAFKTILILAYVNQIDPTGFFLGSLIIIGAIIASEILLNTYGGKSFRLWLSKALISFGSPISENQKSNYFPISSVPEEQTPSAKTGTIVSPSQESLHQQEEEIEATPKKVEKMEFQQERKPSAFSRVLEGTGILIKALFLTIWMLFISFYEMILAFLVIMTSYYYVGVYQIPIFEFKGFWVSWMFHYSSITMGGWTLNRWHTLLLIGLQLFFIVIVQWYGLTTRKPEGLILRVYRNLTRILLGVVIIALMAHMWYDVIYTQLQLLIAFGFMFFSEITAWKVRSERKRLLPQTPQQEFPVSDSEGTKSDLVKSPKTS